jgi:hypothetical protein
MKEKSYETYKFELECWTKVTSFEQKRQGVEVLLSLPESSKDEYKVCEYIVSKMTTEQLCADDGITKLIKHMDEHLRKDDLGRLWMKYVAFDTVRRTTQSVSEYIAEFGIKYSDLSKDESVKLPSAVLALMLIRRANLNQTDVKLALTGLDYSKKDTLYEQAISALRKYTGDDISCVSTSMIGAEGGGLFSESFSQSIQIKNEVNEAEAYYGGWNKGSSRYGRGRPRGRYGNTRGYSRGPYRNQDGSVEQQKPQQNKDVFEHFNPKNRFGEYLKCHNCGSFRHLNANCPDNKYSQTSSYGPPQSSTLSAETNPWPVLYTGNISVYASELVVEANNSAVLDSACSSTVCGETWMDNYVESLPADKKDLVRVADSDETFRFGGGEVLKSKGIYTIPASLAGNNVFIKTDVVESHIPLLFSLDAMKKASVVLHTKEDKAEVMGNMVNLNVTSCGHYCLPLINDEIIHVDTIQEVMKVDLPNKDIVKNLKHLHRQFAHPSSEKLSELLKNSNSWKIEYKKIIDDIHDKCETCIKFKKGVRRPVVSLPMAKRFNQVLTMDLKKWDNFWIIYFIDSLSRL